MGDPVVAWRCIFHHTAEGRPNQRVVVTKDRMRDSLWKQRQERRFIRVTCFTYFRPSIQCYIAW